jgi:hypothetical protein
MQSLNAEMTWHFGIDGRHGEPDILQNSKCMLGAFWAVSFGSKIAFRNVLKVYSTLENL